MLKVGAVIAPTFTSETLRPMPNVPATPRRSPPASAPESPALATSEPRSSRGRRGRLFQLASDTGLYTAGNVFRRGFSVITMPVFTRYLPTAGYGTLAIVGTVQNMLEVIYEMGVAAAATRFFYQCRTDAERQKLFGTLFAFSFLASLVLTAGLLVGGGWLWSLADNEIPFFPYLALTVGTVFLGNVAVLPRVLFRVHNQVPRFFRLSVAQTACQTAVSVALVVWLAQGALGPILATFVVSVFFVVIYARIVLQQAKLGLDWPTVGRALRFGLPDLPVRSASWALKVADRLILQHFTSLSVVAIYSVGYGVAKLPFDLVANGIHWAIVPFFYATATTESERHSQALFARIATYNVVILAFLGAATVLFGRELIAVLASAKYADAERVLPIVVAASFLQASAHIPNKGLFLKEKTAYLPLLVVIPAAVNIGLNFLLIPSYGMMGAAWATLIAYALMIVMTLSVSQAVYRIPYESGRIARVIAIAVLVAGVGAALDGLPLLSRVAAKAAVLAAFPLLLYAVGVPDRTERTALWAHLRDRFGGRWVRS